MNLNDRILWHFFEEHCKYFVTAGRGYASPAASVWIYPIPPVLRELQNFCCVIAIKEHTVLTRIDYGTKESTPDYTQVVSKEWRRRSFNVFRLIQWIESNEDRCIKCIKTIHENQEKRWLESCPREAQSQGSETSETIA